MSRLYICLNSTVDLTRFRASSAVYLRTSVFWDVTTLCSW